MCFPNPASNYADTCCQSLVRHASSAAEQTGQRVFLFWKARRPSASLPGALPGRHLRQFGDPGEATNLRFPRGTPSGGSRALPLGHFKLRRIPAGDTRRLRSALLLRGRFPPPLFLAQPSAFVFPSGLGPTLQTGSGILQAVISLCPQAAAPHFRSSPRLTSAVCLRAVWII